MKYKKLVYAIKNHESVKLRSYGVLVFLEQNNLFRVGHKVSFKALTLNVKIYWVFEMMSLCEINTRFHFSTLNADYMCPFYLVPECSNLVTYEADIRGVLLLELSCSATRKQGHVVPCNVFYIIIIIIIIIIVYREKIF
jgi:hypothetical protein